MSTEELFEKLMDRNRPRRLREPCLVVGPKTYSLLTQKGETMNPFTKQYLEGEVAFYGLFKYEENGVQVLPTEIQGRCDDYFNVSMHFGEIVPVLWIDGDVWMSLTYMEVQSAYLAIQRATGVVATGGLGLGYYALRVAAKPDVSKVIVYEHDDRIINFFQSKFKSRPEFSKIEIVKGDARKTFKGLTCDFCFMDIYPTMLHESVLSDMELFTSQNNIGHYNFWCQELALLKAREYGIRARLHTDEIQFFSHWESTHGSRLRSVYIDNDEWLSELVYAMNELRKVKRKAA